MFSSACAAAGEGGQLERGWPLRGSPHFEQWGALRGVVDEVSDDRAELAVTAVGVLGADERVVGAIVDVDQLLTA